MKINTDGTRSYRECKNCPEIELTTEHIYSCPAILAALHSLDELSFQGDLYNTKIKDIAMALFEAHGLL